MPHLTPEYLPGLPIFGQRFFEQLFQSIPTQTVLVFDNYHVLAKDSLVHEVIRIAASERSKGAGMIVMSRAEPPGTLTRLQVEQQLALIEQETLRLTRPEAAQLVRLHMKRAKKKSVVGVTDGFYGKTNGWLAGMVLLLQQTKNPSVLATPSSTPEVLFNYLAREVFSELDDQTREVLLKTAVLPSMTVPMAEALSGVPEAGAVLGSCIASAISRNGERTGRYGTSTIRSSKNSCLPRRRQR